MIRVAVRKGPIDALSTWGISPRAHGTYMRSDPWKALRRLKYKQVGRRCEDCGTTRPKRGRFEVHHLTYERWKEELLSDLRVLCQECHTKRHRVPKNQRPFVLATYIPPKIVVPNKLLLRAQRDMKKFAAENAARWAHLGNRK